MSDLTDTAPSAVAKHAPATVAHAFANLMNSHDPDAVEAFVAEEYVNHNFYVGDGREANRAFWTQWFAAFPDTEVSLDDVVVEEGRADGDRVAGRFTYCATFLGQFMGLPPTGGRVVMHSIDIWRVVDGMAVEHWDQLDTQDFMAQLTGGLGGQAAS